MKILYIKFNEWDQNSLDKTIQIVGTLRIRSCEGDNAVESTWKGLLYIVQEKECFTANWQ